MEEKQVNTVEIYQDGSFKYIWAPVGHEDDPELQELCRQILKTYESDSKDDVKTLREMRDLNRNGRYTVSAMRHMLPIPYKGGSSEYEDAFLTLYAICCGSKPHYVTETPKKPECFENPGGDGYYKIEFFGDGEPWIENPRYQYMLDLIASVVVV